MQQPRIASDLPLPEVSRLTAYLLDLELEVDRLRRHNRHVNEAMRHGLTELRQRCMDVNSDAMPDIAAEACQAIKHMLEMLHDLQDPSGYHPAHDQVVPIAVRPLTEQLFRWHQWLSAAQGVTFNLELESEHVEWFPARLRHILDNLLSNALKYRDQSKQQPWVRVALSISRDWYEFRVSDNGVGLTEIERDRAFDLLGRVAPIRNAGLGVGLSVVKQLVEQSGGTLTTDAGDGQGTTITVMIPRYELDDYLT